MKSRARNRAEKSCDTVLRRTSKSRRLECSVRPLAAATAPKKLRFMPLVRPTAQHWGTWQLCGGRVRRASNR